MAVAAANHRAQSTRDRGEDLRKKIQATQLLNRLRDHAQGKCEMSSTQVKAAQILLAKALPDLKAIEHSGEVAQKVHAVVVPAKQLESDGNAVAPITQAG